MRHGLTLALGLLGVATSTAAWAANPWEQLMGRKPEVWSDPGGRFSTDLPVGWKAEAKETDPVVRFVRVHPGTGLTAQIEVQMRPLPNDVRATHLDAHVQGENRSQAPGYKVLERKKVSVAGTQGVQTYFSYRARNNADLGREVVQTVFVLGERGYILTLETLAGARPLFWEEFELILKGFSVRGSAQEPRTSSNRRRRIRAGEMINPDAVGY